MRRETFQTPGELHVDVRVQAGEVSFTSVDGDETVVEVEAGDADVNDAVRIELRRRGSGHELLVEVERKRFRLVGSDVEVRIATPHGANVEVSTGSADVYARGRFGAAKLQLGSGDVSFDEAGGRVDVKSGSGDVEIARVGGDATVHTGSGDIRLGSVTGDATLRSGSGDVEVDEAAASVTVQTASGDQRLSSVLSGHVTAQSASGDITVGVRRGTRVRIDAKTLSGDTHTDLGASDAPPTGDVLELRATALSGDIRILRA